MANGIVKWFREKLNLIGLRFWMFREIRMWKVRGDLIVWGMLLQLVGETTPHACRRS